MLEEDFPLRLSKLRIAKNVSAREMSLAIGQNPNYIFNIEAGRSMPSMQGFLYICEYLGITPGEFFDEEVAYPPRFNKIVGELKRLTPAQLSLVEELIRELGKK